MHIPNEYLCDHDHVPGKKKRQVFDNSKNPKVTDQMSDSHVAMKRLNKAIHATWVKIQDGSGEFVHLRSSLKANIDLMRRRLVYFIAYTKMVEDKQPQSRGGAPNLAPHKRFDEMSLYALTRAAGIIVAAAGGVEDDGSDTAPQEAIPRG
jgi:hypothetical protein